MLAYLYMSLVGPYSSSKLKFVCDINTRNPHHGALNSILNRKSLSNNPDSNFEINNLSTNVSNIGINMRNFLNNDRTRICVGLGTDYIVHSAVNSDMIVSLVSDGGEYAGFATVNYIPPPSPIRNVASLEEAMFTIDIICADQLLRGVGTYILNFLKSIVDAEANRQLLVERNYSNYFTVALDSVNSAPTLAFYAKNGFVQDGEAYPTGSPKATLIPHFWSLNTHKGEIEFLKTVYINNNYLDYVNTERSETAMDWTSGGKKYIKKKYIKKKYIKKTRRKNRSKKNLYKKAYSRRRR